MSDTLREQLPRRLAEPVGQSVVVVAVLVVLDTPLAEAAAVGGAYLALQVAATAAEVGVGDYAGNALVGALVLVGTAWVGIVAGPLSWPVPVGVAVGGWLLVDGVQHLRYGVERDGVVRGVSRRPDSGPLRAVPWLLVGRFLEPFRLPVADDSDDRAGSLDGAAEPPSDSDRTG